MARVEVDQIVASKLPQSLSGGAFKLSHTQSDGTGAYYKFHDELWMADTRHLLGWSREALHSLDRTEAPWEPHWVFGHSFEFIAPGRYRLSNSQEEFSKAQLIEIFTKAASDLESAEVSIDQWGHKSHEDWHTNILEQSIMSQGHPLFQLAIDQKIITPIELWNLCKNHCDFLYHPEYVVSREPSVIATPRSEEEHEALRQKLRSLTMMASGVGQTHANDPLIIMDFQATARTGAATEYLAIFTAAPSDTGVGTEVSTSSTAYARIAITMNATNFTPISVGTVLLAVVQTYSVCGASNYGTCTDAALMAAVSGGTQPFYWGDLNAPVIINTGNQLSFPANSVTFAFV